MTASAISDFTPFIQGLVAKGHFESEGEVLAEGIRMLQAREMLYEEVRQGFESIDNGKGIPGEIVFAEVRERIAKIERGEL